MSNEPTNATPEIRPRRAWGDAALPCALLAVFLVYGSFFFDRFVNAYDEGWVICPAERILAGEVPYRDFFLQINPALHYLLAGVFLVAGPSLLAGRAVALAVNACCLLLVYALGRKTAGRWPAAAGATCFAFWSTNQFNIPWYTNLAVLFGLLAVAIRAYLRERAPRAALFAAGAAVGAACLAKQNTGGAFAVGVLASVWIEAALARRPREAVEQTAAFALGGLAAILPPAIALAAAGALDDWYYFTVTFARQFATRRFVGNPFSLASTIPLALAAAGGVAVVYALVVARPVLASARHRSRLVVLLLAVVALWFAVPALAERAAHSKTLYYRGGLYEQFVACATEVVLRALPVLIAGASAAALALEARTSGRADSVALSLAVSAPLCLYASVITNADPAHLVTASAPVWALLPFAAERFGGLLRGAISDVVADEALKTRAGAVALGAFTFFVAFAGHLAGADAYVTIYAESQPVARNTYALRAPRARGIRTDPEQGAALDGLAAYLGERTEEGEAIFVFPNDVTLYAIVNRPNATFYNGFFWDTFVPGDSERVTGALESRGVRYAVVRRPPDREATYNLFQAYDTSAEPILEYLAAGFRAEARFGDYVVVRRRE